MMSPIELVLFFIAVCAAAVSVGAAAGAYLQSKSRRRAREAQRAAERRSTAVGRLRRWQIEGVLIIEDEALEAAMYWEKANPDALEKMVHLIGTILEERSIKPGNGAPLVLAARQDEAVGEHKAPRRSLDLITGFG